MTIAKTVLDHLETNRVRYELLPHPHTRSSQETAEAAHVSGDELAKAVVLEKQDGQRVLAVLPASRIVQYPELEARYGAPIHPADNEALGELFPDCEAGAIPPFGTLYGLETAVDQALLDVDPVYFEAGDHESIVRVSAMDFRSLLFGSSFLPFSRRRLDSDTT
jgi:Ala-tRNA(Pro) deacylase